MCIFGSKVQKKAEVIYKTPAFHYHYGSKIQYLLKPQPHATTLNQKRQLFSVVLA